MSMIKGKLAGRLARIVFLFLAVQATEVLAGFTDVPPPPTRPDQFHSREELKRYLQLVHEYYAIIGRPRFGRTLHAPPRDYLAELNSFDVFGPDQNQLISRDEFYDRLKQ